ncbi:MAG: FAD-dependent oxidoreductase [Alphaproteobacteria bacterium]|jgi:fumarate reductase flavoprotein subunit|nr:FAD-dependent oxidoreductase [Alphaproteobacteria bacterium]|tara:strand:+ start:530 stop:2062 length:1533 start_codon:yes stop_codon:yes gene_type:complete
MVGQAGAPAEVDVVIVGGGGTGLAAAIEARLMGRQVVLLEKNAELGGSTAWSIGSITASNTRHQRREGIQDSPLEHFEDMPKFAPEVAHLDNDELRWLLCQEMPDTFQWLLDKGIRFHGPVPEPPHRKPRMHTVLPNAKAYIYHLERYARQSGVDVRKDLRANTLIVESGRVIGVACEGPSGTQRFLGRGGVVLTAGDFTNSPELKAEYISDQAAKVEGVNPTATGDGQVMAIELGARIINGDQALGPEIRFIAPEGEGLVGRLPPWGPLAALMEWSMGNLPQWLLRPFVLSFLTTALAPTPALFDEGAVLVNKLGKRFCDELDGPAFMLPDQPDKVGYIVVDEQIAKKFSAWPHYISTAPSVAYAYMPDYRRNRPDVYNSAPSWAQLAAKLGVEAGVLETAVAEHNAALDTLGSDGDNRPRPKLESPPFYALGPVRSVFVHNEGGLVVDSEHRVLDGDDQPIPGLFAAGATGQGGLLLKGHGHHLAWAFTSGRRAGRRAAFEVTSADLE